MKHTERNHNETLENLVADGERSCAPSVDAVLDLVRQEKAARSRRRIAAAASVFALAVATITVSRLNRTDAPGTIAQAPPVETVPAPPILAAPPPVAKTDSDEREWKVERINDQQLLEMLDDQPVALVEYPDGNRRLIMMVDLEAATTRQNAQLP